MPNDSSGNSDGEYYVVEKVLDKRVVRGRTEYLLQWANYPRNQATWEPASGCLCHDLIRLFEEERLSGISASPTPVHSTNSTPRTSLPPPPPPAKRRRVDDSNSSSSSSGSSGNSKEGSSSAMGAAMTKKKATATARTTATATRAAAAAAETTNTAAATTPTKSTAAAATTPTKSTATPTKSTATPTKSTEPANKEGSSTDSSHHHKKKKKKQQPKGASPSGKGSMTSPKTTTTTAAAAASSQDGEDGGEEVERGHESDVEDMDWDGMTVRTVFRDSDPAKTLMVTLERRDSTCINVSAETVNRKIPLKIIKFYEGHLKFSEA